MLNTIIIALVVLVAICLVAIAFLFGYILCMRLNKSRSYSRTGNTGADKPKMSEQEKRQQQRFLKEMQNFLNYTGDKQEDINV